MITVKDIVLPINNGVLSSQDLVIILELTTILIMKKHKVGETKPDINYHITLLLMKNMNYVLMNNNMEIMDKKKRILHWNIDGHITHK